MLLALYPTIAQIGPVRLYGVVIAVAILSAYFVALKLAPGFGITARQVDEALLYLVIFGFLGARLYFVVFSWDYFSQNPGEIFAVWRGGLAIYGAIIGGLLGLLVYAKRSGLKIFGLLDLTAMVLPLGQAIGRWGNYFNQEAYGRPTDLPWKMYVEPQFRPAEYLTFHYFHPAFLYESLWDLIIFGVLLYSLATPTPSPLGKGEGSPPPMSEGEKERGRTFLAPGTLFAFYLILYPLGRFFIEGLRLDSFFAGSFRVDQIASLAMIMAGAVFLYRTYKTNRTN